MSWLMTKPPGNFFPILATWVHADPLIVHLTIDGELIETTPEHPFRLANGDWVPAAVLEIDSQVQRANGTTGLVAAIEFINDSQLMYNLTVVAAHTFFVGDGQWLVHNTCGGKVANGHAYNLHVIDRGEFPEINNRQEFADLIDDIIQRPDENKALTGGRHAYWKDDTVVITNPRDPDGGTAFRPTRGKAYYDNLR